MKKIHDFVLAERRLKVRDIAEKVPTLKDCVDHILHEILDTRKLSARWVPRLRNRETTEPCLTLYKRNPKEFLRRFVTVDETWIHWYTPETKEQLKRAPKKAKIILSTGKVIATVFWDSQRVTTPTTWRRAKRSQDSTVPNYWADSTPNCRKNHLQSLLAKKKMLLHHDNT